MAAFVDNVRFNPTAGGTTDWTYSSAVAGYQSPALAGIQNGINYRYYASLPNLTQWEIGVGSYNTGTNVLPRTTVLYNSSGTGTASGQSGAGTKINFSSTPTVAIVALAEDLISIEIANAFSTAQQHQARTNILAIGTVSTQVFTSGTQTYTPSTGMQYCIVETVGGGAGGGTGTGTSTSGAGGGGGGAGSYARKTLTFAAANGQTVTVGAGGNSASNGNDTSFGSLCIGKAGTAGINGTNAAVGTGGAGGVAGTGDVTSPGGDGGSGGNFGASLNINVTSGQGGASFFGGGGKSVTGVGGSSTTGGAASAYGAGGGGGVSEIVAGTGAGGAGAGGVVIVTEFCSP